MKHFCVFLFVFCVGWTLAQQPKTTVQFSEATYDFGTIQEVAGDVSHTFDFKNTGSNPFIINNISVSCGCTTPQYNKAPVLAGQSGRIKITFDPTNRPGRFSKVVIINGNDSRGAINLTVTGAVAPRPRTVEDDYPVLLNQGVRLEDVELNMGNAPRDRATSRTLKYVRTTNPSAVLSIDNSALPGWASVRIDNEQLTVTVDPSKEPMWGYKTFEIPMMVNGVRQPFEVYVMSTFVEYFGAMSSTEMQDAPRGNLSNYFYHFSTVKKGQKLMRTFEIVNSGVNPLIIRALDPSSPKVRASSNISTIKNGERATITVELDSSQSGAATELVRIITNDPNRPVQQVRVMANII